MEDARFITILNGALARSGLDLREPASPTDPRVVAGWAEFLRRCVADGVSISDPRWQDLELSMAGGAPRLVLSRSRPARRDDAESDFTLGLSLLMSMLGRSRDSDDC